jgi:hypothetical protein
MGLFDFFRRKPDVDKTTRIDINRENSNSTAKQSIAENDDDIVAQEIEVGDFGGAKPSLTLRKSGRIYLIVEVPPFHDGDGHEIDGDDDFPEVSEFEHLISEYVGVQVERDDREVFRIDHPKADTLTKVKAFMENYWSLRKDKYKTK